MAYQEENANWFPQQPSGPSVPSGPMKTYNMFYTTSRTNVTLHRGDAYSPAEYYGRSVLLTVSKPQLLLHRGESDKVPIVAFARLAMTSRHMLIGLGDSDNDPEDKLQWEKLEREKNAFKQSDYLFGTHEGSPDGSRRMYRWRRNKDKWSSNVFECVDQNGGVVGSLLSGGMFNWKKGGELSVVEELSRELEELLIIGAIAIWTWEASGAFKQGYANDKDDKKD